MIYNSWEWKRELENLISDIEKYSQGLYIDNQLMYFEEHPDEEENVFFPLEKAIAYSAFVVRLIYDAGKLSDEMETEVIRTTEFPSLKTIGYFEKWVDEDCYDFSNSISRTRSARFIINQIIHSFTIIHFSFNQSGDIDGFYISSDRQKDTSYILIRLNDWKSYLRKVTEDDILCMITTWSEKAGQWIVKKSREKLS